MTLDQEKNEGENAKSATSVSSIADDGTFDDAAALEVEGREDAVGQDEPDDVFQQELEEPEAPVADDRPRKFWRRKRFIIPSACLIVLSIAVFAAYLRLSTSPVSLQFLTDRIVLNTQSVLPEEMSFDFKSVSLAIDPLRGLVTRISQPVLKDRNSRLSVSGKELSFGLQALDLLRGQVRVRDIEFDTPSFALHLTSEAQRALSQLNLSEQTEGRSQVETPLARVGNGLFDLHKAVERVIRLADGGGLEEVTIIDGSVSVTAQGSAKRDYWNISSTVRIRPDRNRLSVRASGIGRGGAWRFEGDAKPVTDGRGHEVTLALKDIILPEVFPAFGRQSFSIRSDAPLTLSMRSKFVDENTVPTASFDAEIGSSYIHIGRRDVALLDKGTISLIWSPELNAISVEEASLQFGSTVLPFAGFARPSENNLANELDIRLVSRSAVLAPRDVSDTQPLPVELIGVKARFDISSRYLTLDTFELRTELSTIIGSASVDFQPRYPSIAGAFSSNAMPAMDLKRIWPPTLAGGARRWFVRNVKGGVIDSAEIALSIPEGLIGNRDPDKQFPEGAVAGNIEFSGAKVRTFGELPDLSAQTGRVLFDKLGMTVSVENGSAISPNGETVDVPSAIFRLPVLGPRNPAAEATVSMIGSARDLAEISDVKPLGFMTKRGVPPNAIGGRAVAEVTSKFNLSRKVDAADVDTVATVRLSDFSSKASIQGRLISKGDVVVVIDSGGTVVQGTAELDGIAADVDLFLPNGDELGTRTDIRLVLNDNQRKKLGINLGEMLTGPTPVAVGKVDAQGRRTVSVDLKDAQISLAPLGWSKGVGIAGRLDFLMQDTSNGQRLENIRLTGDGFSATGEATISSANGLERLQLSNVSLRRGDRVAADIRRAAANAYIISLNGQQIDVRGLIRAIKNNSYGAADDGGGNTIRYAIDGDVKTLAGFGGEQISNAKFSLQTDGGMPSALKFSGTQGSRSSVSATIEGGNGTSWLSVNAEDGGSLITFLDVTESVQGGMLSLSASLGRGDAATVGQVFLSKFRVGGSESLDQLARSVPGENGRRSVTPGLRNFEQARMDFTLRNGRLVIDDAQVRGPAMGVTLNGSMNLRESRLRLNGVYVPAYGLNNAFSRIPIFGTIVGGGRNQGLLGVTFRVSGNLDNPLLTVNPISAIAPGIFRRIFEFR